MLILAGNSLSTAGALPPASALWLQSADVVVFEEDRGARAALKKAGVQRDYLKWNEHKDPGAWEEITADPGFRLAEFAYVGGVPVKVLPGPTSISTAMAAFPKKVWHYFFAGFPPRDQKGKKKFLQNCQKMGTHCVVMDTPYRLEALLEDIKSVYGGKSKALLAMDLEMETEEFLYKTLNELIAMQLGKRLFVIILPGTFERHLNT